MAIINADSQVQHKATSVSNQFDDLFDLFVDSEHYDSSDTTTDRSSSGDWGSFFEFPNSSVSDLPASPHEQGAELQQPQTSPDGASTSYKNTAGTEESGRSKPYIVGSSHTLPRSSSYNKTKRSSISNVSGTQRRSNSAGVTKLNRKSSFSPKMAQPSVSRRSMQDLWLQKLESSSDKFDFANQYHPLPISPPATSKLPQLSSSDALRKYHRSNGAATASHQILYQSYPSSANLTNNSALHGQFTPITTPLISHEQSHNRIYQMPSTPASTHSNYNGFSPSFEFFTSPQTDRSTSWSYDQPFSFNNSPEFNESKVQPWWPPSASSNTASAEPCECPSYPGQNYPTTSSLTGVFGGESHYSQLPTNALMIEYGDTNESAIDDTPDVTVSFDTDNSTSAQDADKSLQSYVQQRYQRAQSQSPSPNTPRSRRGSRGYHRRSKTGSSSSGKGAGQPSSPAVDFVNYTPDDRKKILTGVAPSGSSKTKARREKEAAEKRRRLSMAAARVVMEAGGDISALEREGFCF